MNNIMNLDDELERGYNATIKCAQIIDDLTLTNKLAVIQTLIDIIARKYNMDAVKLYDYLHKAFIKKAFIKGHKKNDDIDTSELS